MALQPSQQVWAEAAAQRAVIFGRIAGKDLIPGQCTRENVEKWMLELQQKHAAKRTTRWFDKLQPVLAHMSTFEKAITIFTQSDPVVTSLVWGSIKMILDAASALSHALQTIIDMLETIAHAMPRFDEYMQLFPHRERLQKALLGIYCGFLDFCVEACKFFSVHIIVHFTRSFLCSGSLTARFKRLIETLQSASHEFDEEARLAHVVDTKSQLTNIRAVLGTQPSQGLADAASIFSVPWARNDKFYGRGRDLQALTQWLEPQPARQRSCVLHGMGGVGKTQTALEFCYMNKLMFPYTIWLPSETEAVLANAFSKIIQLTKQPGFAGKTTTGDLSSDVDAARQWLCQNKGWLLVFDNVDVPDILNRYWPACDHGSILITTQDRKLVHRAQSAVCLSPLDDSEGSQLLLQYLPKEVSNFQTSAGLARAISKEVQGLPLDLVGLAGFMVDSCTTLSDTLTGLRNHIDQVSDSATFQYGRPTRLAFDVSLKSLTPASLSVLRTLSMLAPDSIPETLLLGRLDDPSLRFEGYMDIARFRRDIRAPLVTRHLIEFHESTALDDPSSYSVHRRIQKKILDDMGEDQTTRQLIFDRCVQLVKNVLPPLNEFMVPIQKEMVSYQGSIAQAIRLEEVFRVCKTSTGSLLGDLPFVELLTSAGFYLYEVRLGAPGLTLLTTAENICAQRLADDSPSSGIAGPIQPQSHHAAVPPDMASVEDSHASQSAKWIKLWATALQIIWAIRSSANGLSLRQQTTDNMTKVLELRQAYADMDTSDDKYVGRVLLANAHNDMAEQLISISEFDAAEVHLDISIAMKEELHSQRTMPPYQFAEQNRNMALIRAGQGRGDMAVQLSRDATDVLRGEGEDGVYSIFLFIYGICLVNVGDLPTALLAFQDCYKLRVAAFGVHGILTLHNIYAISYVQYRLGHYADARQTLLECQPEGGEASWPKECQLRADVLSFMIKHAESNAEKRMTLPEPLLAQLHTILKDCPDPLNGRDIHSLSELDLTYLLDLLVPLDAGRFAMSHRIASPQCVEAV